MTQNDWLIVFDLSQQTESSAVSSVLDLVASITRSDAAHLYWMDPAVYELRLISVSPRSEEGRIPRVSLQFSSMAAPGMLRAGDPGFDSFPETVVSKVSCLLAFPIRIEEKPAGILTLARKEPRLYGPVEIEAARKAGEALAAAMRELERHREVDALRAKLRSAREENMLLEKRLAERKLVERAKGLLQVHFGWSEEDAYYHLRRTSRQQRIPMAVIAQRVIDVVAAGEVEQERIPA